jgi:hypothetical protein
MGEHEAGEKFEMIWCCKEKDIEEYIWDMGEHEAGEKFEMIWCGKEKPLKNTK